MSLPDTNPILRLTELLEETDKKLKRRQRNFGPWKHANYWIGGLSAVLTAAAGVGILTEWLSTDFSGAVAVGAAVLTALVGFYDFDARTVRVGIERAEWRRLHHEALSLGEKWEHLEDLARLAAVNGLWDRFCNLERADAEARAPQ